MEANYMRVIPGGLCFAHGPYTEGAVCPQWPDCVNAPSDPKWVAVAKRQMEQQEILQMLGVAWKQYPTLRLCQFISNIFGPGKHDDIFFYTDADLKERLASFDPQAKR